ncbi:MAG: N-acetylmuramoyl-L-alanine amidase [Bacteroidales bacterium]|nr:N-acetylmuramoyl-L-alanine amidase [Bacteroidales bacterium]
MKCFRLGLLAMSVMLCGNIQAKVDLKIVRGERDTVYSKTHYVVGVTNPGNRAIVNGERVKVYKTGSFGAEVQLKEGLNRISVIVDDGLGENNKEFNVFYSTNRPEKLMTSRQAKKDFERNKFKNRNFNVVSKAGAYLQYGDGDDRLGGSKMGFVTEGIVFKVVGEKGGLYKVQLSQNRYAYMDKDYLEPTEEDVETVNTGSWRVSNKGEYDQVYISLPKRLPYHYWTELDPTRICIDVYGAMDNSNWMTQYFDTEMIEYVNFNQVESDVYRVIIKLKDKYSWGYSVDYSGTNLVINVNHAPNPEIKGLVVGLDAGHGGKYPGAISASGITEKEVNLSIINEIKALLEDKGAKVVLSRDGDQGPTMGERKKIFKEAGVDLMISVHNNSGGSPLAEMGSCTAYKHVSDRALAVAMQKRLVELGHKNFGVIGNFNFSLNSPTEYPNVLLEVLFMSSLPEEEKLADDEYRKKIAKQVVLALEDYLNDVKASRK